MPYKHNESRSHQIKKSRYNILTKAMEPGSLVIVDSTAKNAICPDAGDTQRDQPIQTIAQQGRIAWQQKTEAWISASALNRLQF